MIRFVVAIALAGSVVLPGGCAEPSKPVLPDGLHRVPVNRVPPVPPVTSPAGERDEG
ncbi:MAG TPA: hypothetical protein VJS30_27795 [Paraburkholderia sp.]|nr:hypothetical protein [Paraburkholderia sp.]